MTLPNSFVNYRRHTNSCPMADRFTEGPGKQNSAGVHTFRLASYAGKSDRNGQLLSDPK